MLTTVSSAKRQVTAYIKRQLNNSWLVYYDLPDDGGITHLWNVGLLNEATRRYM
jgi:hypothetical protein